jgi:hypothetical protein
MIMYFVWYFVKRKLLAWAFRYIIVQYDEVFC